MSLLQDLLQEVPLSAVLKERVALADDKFARATREIEIFKQRIADLERENETLRSQIPATKSESALGDDTTRVLVYLFKTTDREQRDVGVMARALQMERNVLQYHLDRLKAAGMAEQPAEIMLNTRFIGDLQPLGGSTP